MDEITEITCTYCNIYPAMTTYELDGEETYMCYTCVVEIESYKELEEEQ